MEIWSSSYYHKCILSQNYHLNEQEIGFSSSPLLLSLYPLFILLLLSNTLQNRNVSSADPLHIVDPSGDKAICNTLCVCPWSYISLLCWGYYKIYT